MAGANIWPSEGDLPGFRDAVLCYQCVFQRSLKSFPTLPNSHAAVKLGKSLFPLFAIALDLPQSFFDDKVLSSTAICFTRSQLFQTKYSAALMKLLLYPPQTGPSDERVIGIGAHTEYTIYLSSFKNQYSHDAFWAPKLGGKSQVQSRRSGFIMNYLQCFTILWQEPGIQALQVLNTNKQWINAPPIPGTLIIKQVSYSRQIVEG